VLFGQVDARTVTPCWLLHDPGLSKVRRHNISTK
jgi:hypothetical protein